MITQSQIDLPASQNAVSGGLQRQNVTTKLRHIRDCQDQSNARNIEHSSAYNVNSRNVQIQAVQELFTHHYSCTQSKRSPHAPAIQSNPENIACCNCDERIQVTMHFLRPPLQLSSHLQQDNNSSGFTPEALTRPTFWGARM